MGMPQLLVALEQREQRADGEQYDGDQERPEVALTPEAEGVLRRGLAGPRPTAEGEQRLVASVGHRMDRLGQHRGRAGEQERDELDYRDTEIGQERCQDRPGAALVHSAHRGRPPAMSAMSLAGPWRAA